MTFLMIFHLFCQFSNPSPTLYWEARTGSQALLMVICCYVKERCPRDEKGDERWWPITFHLSGFATFHSSAHARREWSERGCTLIALIDNNPNILPSFNPRIALLVRPGKTNYSPRKVARIDEKLLLCESSHRDNGDDDLCGRKRVLKLCSGPPKKENVFSNSSVCLMYSRSMLSIYDSAIAEARESRVTITAAYYFCLICCPDNRVISFAFLTS